jgi:hypothetical protein
VDDEHQVVREHCSVRAVRPVHAADVASHAVAERAEQLGQRAIEVEAVTAPLLVGDAAHRLPGIDAPALTLVDPDRLVRDGLDLGRVDTAQGRGCRRLGLQAETAEVGDVVVAGARGHGR